VIPLHDDNPTRSTPVVTILLILANVAVFLLQTVAGDSFTYAFAMIPAEVLPAQGRSPFSGVNVEPAWVTLFTSMFLHGGWMHLIGNMLYLWIFGNNLEDTLGKIRFLFFYLACGAAAAVVHLVTNPASVVPTVGASGAIAGVLGGYILLFPHARISTLVIFLFITVIEIPAKVVLGVWFLLQLLNAVLGSGMMLVRGGEEAGGVAFWAHVGGFVAGYVLIRLMGGRRREPPRRRPAFMDY
jgi:membrane associated rhomboid family serine protease